MATLDLLERKLLKIFAEANQVKLKRRWGTGAPPSMTVEEQRELIHMLLRRVHTLPEEKQQEVRTLLRLYDWEVKS
jgi:hypothetical protein